MTGKGWTQEHLMLFSDDTFCFWHIRSFRDLRTAASHLLTVIDAFESMDMSINFTKSNLACSLKGTHVTQAHQYYMQWMDGASFFKLRRRTQTLHIPITDDVDYLGVVLSYRNFELATAKHRIKKAGITYKSLQKVLRVKGPLGTRYKLRIYRACVLACLLYGLIGVGLTQASFKLVSLCVCKHIRKILCVHEEGVSSLAVLERASIDLHADLVGRSRALIASAGSRNTFGQESRDSG